MTMMFPMRVPPGVELTSYLQEYVIHNDIRAAFVLTCVGSVKQVNLRFATGINGKEATLNVAENLEICALSGTISKEGFHLHGTFGNTVGGTVSGHIVGNMMVQTTAEVVLGNAVGWTFKRSYDPITNFRELQVIPAALPLSDPDPHVFPTDDDLKTCVSRILEEANLEEITMKKVIDKIFKHYSMYDLTGKKDLIKETVKALIHSSI